MKNTWTIFLVTLVLVLTGPFAFAGDKAAFLVLPAKAVLRGLSVELRPAVEILWDEKDPVSVDVEITTVQPDGRSLAYIVGYLRIYDAAGNEVEQAISAAPMSIANGKRAVMNGEILRMPLVFNSAYVFRKLGRYYAIAEFSGTSTRGAKIVFRSAKQWFEVM